MTRAIFSLLLLTSLGHGDVLLKFNKGPQVTSAFTFEDAVSLHQTAPYLQNDGNGNDGPGSGAVQITVASGGTGSAILSSGYTITRNDVGKKVSASVWHYRSGSPSFAEVALGLLLDGTAVGTETSALAFGRGAADVGTEPTLNYTGEYTIQAGDVGKKLSLRFHSTKTSSQEKGVSYAIDAVTFLGVGG